MIVAFFTQKQKFMFNFRTLSVLMSLTIVGAYFANLKAQAVIIGQDTTKRPITTAVPFLNIAPDARAAGMGDLGAATSPDANAVYWNASKLVFAEEQYGVALSYSPWLRQLVDDMSLTYLSGFYRLDDQQAFGFGLRYFNLGEIEFTDINGLPIRDFRPNEFAVTLSYARKLGENFSASISGRFIHSNLSADIQLPNQQDSRPGTTGAADIGFFYKKEDLNLGGKEAKLAIGVNVSNIGAKITYSTSNERDFIPTNLRIGSALTMSLDPMNINKLTVGLDFNKLMVPTPPRIDSQGNIIEGTDPRERSLISGVFGSFADAPDGFSEELQEFTTSLGLEYAYREVFFVRGGYFSEHENKGNRKYFSLGAGFKYRKFGVDVAYLIPPQSQNNPLAETLRFSFNVNFDSKTERTYDGSEIQ